MVTETISTHTIKKAFELSIILVFLSLYDSRKKIKINGINICSIYLIWTHISFERFKNYITLGEICVSLGEIYHDCRHKHLLVHKIDITYIMYFIR